MDPRPEAQTCPTLQAGGVLAFPASVAQQTFWYLDFLQNDVSAFNVPLRFRLTGPLDVGLLELSLNSLIARHEALRTHFEEEDGQLLQIVSPEIKIRIPVIDISHMPADRIDGETDRLGSIEARRPFQLSKGPMIRAELVRMSPDSHILHVTVHHALFDGMSMTILTRELAAVYQALHENKPCPLEPLDLQYGDFSVWQHDFLESPEMKRQLAYWKQRLAGMKELDLPTDFPRPAVKSWKGDITSILLPAELTDRLHSIAASNGATLFHLQLAAYMVLLRRYTGADDVAVGTPVTGRTRGELDAIIGVFINSLILRGDLSGNPSFESLLGQVKSSALDALENQEIPFECLVRELRPKRDASRNPLFQVNFNHHRSFAQAGTFGGVTLTPVPSRSPGTIFDLHFFMVERKEGWRASCDYSTDLFTLETANRMLEDYKRLLEDIAESPEKRIDDLEIPSKPGFRPGMVERQPDTGPPAIVPADVTVGNTEERLLKIWRDLLGIHDIGPDDDFFELGGHSLMALRMFARISREFGKSPALATLLEQPTIARLAPLVASSASAGTNAEETSIPPSRHRTGADDRGNIVTLAEGGSRPALFCIHGGDGGVIFYQNLAKLLPTDIAIHAIESLELGGSGPVESHSIEETAEAYLQIILRVQTAGPFRLAGYSFGGVVAHEIARRLVGMGHEVGFLGLFDTHNPAAPARFYRPLERVGIFWASNRELPFTKRISSLSARIKEGIRTHRTVGRDQREARLSGPAPAFSDLRRIQIREENWRAMLAYQPKPFSGRITLFKTTHVEDKVERPADYGWSALALSGLDIVSVSGHHLEIFSPGHVEALAAALARVLKLSERPASC